MKKIITQIIHPPGWINAHLIAMCRNPIHALRGNGSDPDDRAMQGLIAVTALNQIGVIHARIYPSLLRGSIMGLLHARIETSLRHLTQERHFVLMCSGSLLQENTKGSECEDKREGRGNRAP